jgi:hypothetical protein
MKQLFSNMKCHTSYYRSSCFWSRVVLIVMLGLALMSQYGCKSKKKILAEQQAQEQAEMAAKVDKARSILLNLLDDNNDMSLEEKERQLAFVKQQNLQNQEIQDLIRQVEQKLLVERAKREEDRKRKEEEAEREKAQAEGDARKPRVLNRFNQIVNALTIDQANAQIKEALKLFASPDVPVLIIINENRNQIDYDEPTTIERYLHYLKDQKRNPNRIKDLEVDGAGKINKVVLTRD